MGRRSKPADRDSLGRRHHRTGRAKRTATKHCRGKVAHRSEAAALRHKQHLINDLGASPYTVMHYQCRFCDAWHVGHRPGSTQSL